jgi:uncharacterized protein
MGEMVGREVARRLGAQFGVLDLSLAPTPAVGDSVAAILEAMGLESCGTHGTTAALACSTMQSRRAAPWRHLPLAA